MCCIIYSAFKFFDDTCSKRLPSFGRRIGRVMLQRTWLCSIRLPMPSVQRMKNGCVSFFGSDHLEGGAFTDPQGLTQASGLIQGRGFTAAHAHLRRFLFGQSGIPAGNRFPPFCNFPPPVLQVVAGEASGITQAIGAYHVEFASPTDGTVCIASPSGTRNIVVFFCEVGGSGRVCSFLLA